MTSTFRSKSKIATFKLRSEGTEVAQTFSLEGSLHLPTETQVTLSFKAEAQVSSEALAVNTDSTQAIIRVNPATGGVEFNVAPARVFKAAETNWLLSSLSQSDLNAQVPSAQIIN